MEAPLSLARILEITGNGFTVLQLFEKAARLKDLVWNQNELPIKAIPVEKTEIALQILSKLTERGFQLATYPNVPRVWCLIDEDPKIKRDLNYQGGEAFYNWWSFLRSAGGDRLRKEKDQVFELNFKVNLRTADNGIVFKPGIGNNYDVPRFSEYHQRLFLLLSDHYRSPLLQEMAAAGGTLMISWEQLGLIGLVSTQELFEQFCGQNQLLWRLTNTPDNPFNPKPLDPGSHPNLYFLQKEAIEIFQIWQWQRENYIHSLRI